MSDEHNGVTNGTGDVRRIQAPTLVIQGERDYVVPMTMAEGIANAIDGAQLVILPDCGHSPLVDCLDALVEKMVVFLQK